MRFRKSCIAILLIALIAMILFFGGCGGEDNNDENGQQAEMPGEILEMESGLLRIMQQADLVPIVFSEQVQPDNGAEEENEVNEEAEAEPNDEDGDEDEEANGESEAAVAQMDELTFEDTILWEVLDKETDGTDEEDMPESTEIIWNDIKETVLELHNEWNELEPLLVAGNITQDVIDYFEEGLDNLTMFSTEQDYFATMDTANQLTAQLSEFMVPFSENVVSLTYGLKFHIRNLVLQAAKDDYASAQKSLDNIKEQRPDLAKELDEAEFRELELSLDNLQRVLDKQNLDLIIINAAVVMENMVQVIERTAE